MTYLLIAYLNWVLAGIGYGLLPRQRRTATGWLLIAAAAVVQLLAFAWHWYEWNRLRGKPDRLYVWILPALLVLMTFIVIVAAFVVALRRDPPEA